MHYIYYVIHIMPVDIKNEFQLLLLLIEIQKIINENKQTNMSYNNYIKLQQLNIKF